MFAFSSGLFLSRQEICSRRQLSPRGCENQPDDLGWLASLFKLTSLVTFNAPLYDLLNCVAFA